MNQQIPSIISTAELAQQSNLTHGQLLLWMGQQLNPEAPLYNMVLAFTIEEALDTRCFQQAFQALIDRSDTLRTVIEGRNGIPNQRVLDRFAYEVECLDFTGEADPEASAGAWMNERSRRLFDLSVCLFDAVLLKVGEARYIWYLNQHHLTTDGWSVAIFYRNMADFYRRACEKTLGEASTLPPYQAYVAYERETRQSPLYEKINAYWKEKVQEAPAPVRFYGKSLSTPSTRTERVFLDLGAERSAALRQIATEKGVRAFTQHLSLFNIFATVLFAYLYRVSESQRLSIGTPAHNRPTADFKQTLGVFIEVFPFFTEVAEDETFFSLLQKVNGEAMGFLRYAQPGANRPTYNHRFNVVLNYINASFPDFRGSPMQSEWIHPGHGDTQHHLRLQVHDFDASGSFQLHFDFNTDLFDETLRREAIEHYLQVLDAFIEDREQSIQSVNLLSDAERQHLLVAFNQTDTAIPEGDTVISAFEKQASATPEAVALVFEGQQWTYAQLNGRASRWAKRLQDRGVQAEVPVGIFMRRSPEVLVALLAVLKAGGAYVPIDPAYPNARIEFIIQDTGMPVILTQGRLESRLAHLPHTTVLRVDGPVDEADDGNEEILIEKAQAEEAAYILYTSGSTGQPKGVVVTHRALMNYVCWARQQYVGDEQYAFPFFTTLSFDFTVTSLYVPLLTGGTVVIYPETEGASDLSILQVMEEDVVDVIKLTPAHLSLIKEHPGGGRCLKALILGGENLKRSLAEAFLASYGQPVTIYNEYGPTEATVGCMIHRYDPEKDRGASVPIGRPIANTQIYVLDKAMNPVPRGVVGELYIAGAGLAKAYWNQPELTEARFVPDPFRPGARLCRTGDLARMLPDGNLVYLGRTDNQVKIRGMRVEQGEVETALTAHPAIRDCVVTTRSFTARPEPDEVVYCARCGLASSYPGTTFDEEGVCNQCQAFEVYKHRAESYFRSHDELRQVFDELLANHEGPYDCLALLSGGKDSTYALYQLVGMGLRVMAFTLDNGYISEGAKANIRRVVDALGVDHVFATTPAMNAIFVDSLHRYHNVCNGCFKTIYTLSLQLAHEKGIPIIVTGLSRGQFFETRLTEELFTLPTLDIDNIDDIILDARKTYHRRADAVNQLLDVELLQEDAIFQEVQFVDFYRYCNVELEEMLRFLNTHAPWIRPDDTGRSTNCLINDAGIYVHKQKRGYHNYALPYSWDVRLGHKTRDEALEELDDEIDVAEVDKILDEIGYTGSLAMEEERLAAYYVADEEMTPAELRAHLAERLPAYMVPATFTRLDTLPLSPNGKVDLQALPTPEVRVSEDQYVAPETTAETILVGIWAEVLRVNKVGIHDNFFDLGGDSIMAIQIIARAVKAGLQLVPNQLFQYQTIAELAAIAGAATDEGEAEQGAVAGDMSLSPIQHWFLSTDTSNPHHWNHAVWLKSAQPIDPGVLEQAVTHLLQHHDALRLRLTPSPSGWQAQNLASVPAFTVDQYDYTMLSAEAQDQAMAALEEDFHRSLHLTQGPLLRVAFFHLGATRGERVLFVLHHAAVDGYSWLILLEDLDALYTQISQQQPPILPRKTTSYRAWVEHMHTAANTDAFLAALPYWTEAPGQTPLPVEQTLGNGNTVASEAVVSAWLTEAETVSLLQEVPAVYHTQINDVLLTALMMTLSQWTGHYEHRLDVEGHGRDDLLKGINLVRTVGWFTAIYPVMLRLVQGTGLEEALPALKEQLRKVPDHGISYGALRYLREAHDEVGLLRKQPSPEILFNYLGQHEHLLSETARFRFAQPLRLSRDPKGRRRYLLEINVSIEQGRLRADWTYSHNMHRESTLRRWVDQYMADLRVIIAHCVEAETETFTPTDFPLANLDDRKLGQLTGLLGNKKNILS